MAKFHLSGWKVGFDTSKQKQGSCFLRSVLERYLKSQEKQISFSSADERGPSKWQIASHAPIIHHNVAPSLCAVLETQKHILRAYQSSCPVKRDLNPAQFLSKHFLKSTSPWEYLLSKSLHTLSLVMGLCEENICCNVFFKTCFYKMVIPPRGSVAYNGRVWLSLKTTCSTNQINMENAYTPQKWVSFIVCASFPAVTWQQAEIRKQKHLLCKNMTRIGGSTITNLVPGALKSLCTSKENKIYMIKETCKRASPKCCHYSLKPLNGFFFQRKKQNKTQQTKWSGKLTSTTNEKVIYSFFPLFLYSRKISTFPAFI